MVTGGHVEPVVLSAYVDGELDEAERARVGEHLVRCADCAATAAGYRSVTVTLAEYLERLPVPTVGEVIEAATAGARRHEVSLAWRRVRWVGSVAAVAAVVAALALLTPMGEAAAGVLSWPPGRGAGHSELARGVQMPTGTVGAGSPTVAFTTTRPAGPTATVTAPASAAASPAATTGGSPTAAASATPTSGGTYADRGPTFPAMLPPLDPGLSADLVYGPVAVDGQWLDPKLADTLSLVAKINGTDCTLRRGLPQLFESYYAVEVRGGTDCGQDGAVITFWLGDRKANEQVSYRSDKPLRYIVLTFGSKPAPSTAPPRAPYPFVSDNGLPATPTPTPTPAPPGG